MPPHPASGTVLYDFTAMHTTRQREFWDGDPIELGNAWIIGARATRLRGALSSRTRLGGNFG